MQPNKALGRVLGSIHECTLAPYSLVSVSFCLSPIGSTEENRWRTHIDLLFCEWVPSSNLIALIYSPYYHVVFYLNSRNSSIHLAFHLWSPMCPWCSGPRSSVFTRRSNSEGACEDDSQGLAAKTLSMRREWLINRNTCHLTITLIHGATFIIYGTNTFNAITLCKQDIYLRADSTK